MPAIKGRGRVGQKKEEATEDAIVPENDDVSVEDAPTTKAKGRAAGMKKGKAEAADSKNDDDIEEEDGESVKNGKGDEDTSEKSGPKSRGKGAAKKPSAAKDDDSEEPNKKASKRGTSKDEGNEAVKPKKAGKKEEVLPTRRGGDRAAKKAISYDVEDKVPAVKKGRATKAKNGVSKVAAKEKRGRGGKKAAEDVSDEEMETAEDSETPLTTVSVEHCKS